MHSSSPSLATTPPPRWPTQGGCCCVTPGPNLCAAVSEKGAWVQRNSATGPFRRQLEAPLVECQGADSLAAQLRAARSHLHRAPQIEKRKPCQSDMNSTSGTSVKQRIGNGHGSRGRGKRGHWPRPECAKGIEGQRRAQRAVETMAAEGRCRRQASGSAKVRATTSSSPGGRPLITVPSLGTSHGASLGISLNSRYSPSLPGACSLAGAGT